jgi:PelA/Pel-15E family pectate lyase
VKRLAPSIAVVCLLSVAFQPAASGAKRLVPWKECLTQPAAWYGGSEARRIASLVLLYQRPGGGWPKNIDMALPLLPAQQESLRAVVTDSGATIDNNATIAQIRFLARVGTTRSAKRYRESITRGVEYLLRAQYANGGWPQFFPLVKGYPSHITFNDNAMSQVLHLLLDVSRGDSGFGFTGRALRARARTAVDRGVECILRCQIRVRDTLTVWCAQHDERTFAPVRGRTYELPSFSGKESVDIVEFLLRLPSPSPRVVAAVHGAVRWLSRARLRGVRVVENRDATSLTGLDHRLIDDPAAPPLWARFYALDTGQPLFANRDGVPRDRLSDVVSERRNQYHWYGTWADTLLREEYPRWCARRGITSEVKE